MTSENFSLFFGFQYFFVIFVLKIYVKMLDEQQLQSVFQLGFIVLSFICRFYFGYQYKKRI